jgi:hypothetical protein
VVFHVQTFDAGVDVVEHVSIIRVRRAAEVRERVHQLQLLVGRTREQCVMEGGA